MKRTKHPQSAAEMKRSYLVQRLAKPQTLGLAGMSDNPFSFGGGLRNGGLSSDAMSLLRPIFSFEYMGSAEFEFGAVPEALSKMAEHSKYLVAGSLSVTLADVEKHWSDKSDSAPAGEATIFYLCQSQHVDEVERRIRGWATKPDNQPHTKERVGLSTTLRPGDYAPDTLGWLELDNGFAFFVDRDMWDQTCSLFGVKVEVAE